MIDLLRGSMLGADGESVLIEVGGIGYRVAMTPRAIAALAGRGRDSVVHTHLHVREDSMSLYGFETADERDLFRLLLGASGVGPKLALAILGTLAPAELQRAVLAEDSGALTAVPGIGRKSAQRLILELRSRFEMPDVSPDPSTPLSEVREALEGLGYQPAEVREALSGLADDGRAVEQLLRAALQKLGGT